MAYSNSALLFVLLHYPSLEVYAAQSEVYTFESYTDASCSTPSLEKPTVYLKAVTGSTGCYVYTDKDGVVASGATSFVLTCGAPVGHTEYESESCTGSIVSPGTEPWFPVELICSSQAVSSGSGPGHVSLFTSHSSASCTKSYLPMWR